MDAASAPLIIALPKGFAVSGVTLWAVRLARALAERGRRCVLIAHEAPEGQSRLEIELPACVGVVDVAGRFEARVAEAGLQALLPCYRDVIRREADESGRPVVFSPNLLGDCYGLGAAMCVTEAESIRIVGWQHSDIEYDRVVLERYAPCLARFAGVSERIAVALRERLPARAEDVSLLHYGVEAPATPPPRPPLKGRPVRIVYTGRIEHEQKRIGALLAMSRALTARGVAHELTLIGDGPAAADVDETISKMRGVRRLGALPPRRVTEELDRADVFALASRYEGLSVSMLEAMSRGCAPVVTAVASGAREAVAHGENGALVRATDTAPDDDIGAAMAGEVQRLCGRGLGGLPKAAWETVRDRFSMERHALEAMRLIDEAALAPARAWPVDRPCAFTAMHAGAGSGSVPADGAERLRSLLASLAGRRVLIHGAGRHTIELASVFAESPAVIVGVSDDDPARHGRRLLGWSIGAPERAATTGASDVVLSSWMHAKAMWARRGVFERAGLRVHSAYPDRCGP